MVGVMYRKHGVRIRHCWYPKVSDMDSIGQIGMGTDIIFFHDAECGISGSNKNIYEKEHRTVVSDLLTDKEELFKKIGKNCRYNIRRGERENIKQIIYRSAELKSRKDVLDELEVCYNKLFKQKGMNNRFNRKLVELYVEEECFELSVSYHEKTPLVYHAYIVDEDNVRSLYSCSLFRDDDESRNLIGWANRYQHWNDMMHYKEVGKKYYDWGGISSFDEPNGIDKFKMEFGGEPKVYKNIFVGVTLLGKICLMAYKA